MISIRQFTEFPAVDLAPLVEESKLKGHHFLRRLSADWEVGSNRFSKDGEALFGVYDNDSILAVGGINRQSGTVGRLRRFYVQVDARRKGIGRMLSEHILIFASHFYETVILRTQSSEADFFYRALGFEKTTSYGNATHSIYLRKRTQPKGIIMVIEVPDIIGSVTKEQNHPVYHIPFASELISLIKSGQKQLTYRFGNKYDYLNVGDVVSISDSNDKSLCCKARITEKMQTTFGELPVNRCGHEEYRNKEHQQRIFSFYYRYLG
jgi:GNAT superfamily N-acetyltransferase